MGERQGLSGSGMRTTARERTSRARRHTSAGEKPAERSTAGEKPTSLSSLGVNPTRFSSISCVRFGLGGPPRRFGAEEACSRPIRTPSACAGVKPAAIRSASVASAKVCCCCIVHGWPRSKFMAPNIKVRFGPRTIWRPCFAKLLASNRIPTFEPQGTKKAKCIFDTCWKPD